MKKSFLLLSLVILILSGCNSDSQESNMDQTSDDVTDHMTEFQARQIAEATCIKGGEALGEGYYNDVTKTWWFDANLNATQPGCNPACVVSENTQTAEINWRCTGAITDEDITPSDITHKKETTLKKVSEDGRYIHYEGNITLSGKYNEYHPNTMMGGLLCFHADEATAYLIPRTESDLRDPWFCFNFEDQESVKAQFGIDDKKIFTDDNDLDVCIEGKATIEVSNYVVDLLEGETVDRAKLEKIISKEPYSACQ